ncbi:Flp family type IVb pilin [Tropicimonas sp. IMCC6043]|uniref:Flp family type IVb pilin n=1 Tax=Tropicimonas sp. IMCC6043 TaxID=2510645 RepID=UPI00101DB6A8|nr:Flp family type IVb pilin [Tropicimonas sp. IMCC6043]RYH11296.1 Flp family type IVb pilin [Tropicimonas sp. IMCC6043]
MWKLFEIVNRLNRDERGATIVEYGVALIIVTGVGALVLGNLATDVFNSFTAAEAIM